ncbi:MAG: hypothetical protein WBS19_04590 [Candidatus Korobacteraceae bacterium]
MYPGTADLATDQDSDPSAGVGELVSRFGAETSVVSGFDPPDEEGPQAAADGPHHNATTSAETIIENVLD